MGCELLVTGATGTLGQHVVDAALAAGHRVRALSRGNRTYPGGASGHRGDLLANAGLGPAVAGVDAVIHCATQPTGDKDVVSTGHLIDAVRAAGVGHIVYVSIVGIDRIPLPYYRTKLRAEELLAASGMGHSILRATQFHDLVERTFSAQRFSPVLWALRGVRFQPIDTRDVAARLVELAAAEPAGRVPDIGGPGVHHHTELGRMYLTARGSRRPMVGLYLPGRIAAGYRSGANLAPDNRIGTTGFAEYLASTRRREK
jgi:uncharacterized protein YbjT (DUF2867 family)